MKSNVLHIAANGQIAKVAVGDRTIEVDDVDEATEVELTPAERNKTLRVFVTSTDGRVAQATVDPGVRGIDVVFGDRDTLPPPPPPPSGSAAAAHVAPAHTGGGSGTGPTKRTWQKRGPRK